LTGKEYAGSQGGRRAILAALETLGLEVPTAELPHRLDGLLTIDHIAIPAGRAGSAPRIVAQEGGNRLSDHDIYVIDTGVPSRLRRRLGRHWQPEVGRRT
jgi:hypothetical protein